MTIFSNVKFNKAHFDEIYTVEPAESKTRWGYDNCYIIKRYPFGWSDYEVLTLKNGWGIVSLQYGNDIHVLSFHNVTKNSIDLVSVDVLKDGNQNNDRTYRSEKYLKKYAQIAIILHTSIISGYIDIKIEKQTA